jgi:hypothetical protein
MSDEPIPLLPPDIYDDRAGSAPRLRPAYLGDGVYASHDGHHIWLTIHDHRNGRLVALDDKVMAQLVAYHKQISAAAHQAGDDKPDPNTSGEGEV